MVTNKLHLFIKHFINGSFKKKTHVYTEKEMKVELKFGPYNLLKFLI